MPYDRWNTRAQSWSEQEWISVRKMREVIRYMDTVKLEINKARQDAIDFWGGVERDAPFDHDTEMPNYQTFVAIDQGDWPGKILQMLAALNFKELDQTRAGKERQEQGSRAQMKHKQRAQESDSAVDAEAVAEEPRAAIPNDVLLSFVNSIKAMRAQIGRAEGTFDKEKLERELNIQWH